MSIEANKAVVTRFNKEVIEGKNTAVFSEIFDPRFINRTVRPGFPAGPEGMLQFLTNVLWKGLADIKVEIHDQVGEGDKVTSRKTIHGTHIGEFMGHAGSQKKISINIIDIVRLQNQKYLEHWSIIDVQGVLAQINTK